MRATFKNLRSKAMIAAITIPMLLGVVAFARTTTASTPEADESLLGGQVAEASDVESIVVDSQLGQWQCCQDGSICYVVAGKCPNSAQAVPCPCSDPY